MIFSGKLYFDDGYGGEIDVKRLILRVDEVAFNGTATWDDHDDYEIDTKAYRAGEIFVSGETRPKTETTTGFPVVLSFSKLEKVEDMLSVEGSWLVSGQAHAFSGDLDPFSLVSR